MTKADRIVRQAADKVEEIAATAAEKGGPLGKLAPALEGDAEFLRKMEPSKIARRVRGDDVRGDGPLRPVRALETPQPAQKPRPPGALASLARIGAAFALGVLVAEFIDWRSYAEPGF